MAGTYSVATPLLYQSDENYSLTISGMGSGTTVLDGGSGSQVLRISTSQAQAAVDEFS